MGGRIPSREVGRIKPKALRSFHVVRFISTNAAECVQGHREEKSECVCVYMCARADPATRRYRARRLGRRVQRRKWGGGRNGKPRNAAFFAKRTARTRGHRWAARSHPESLLLSPRSQPCPSPRKGPTPPRTRPKRPIPASPLPTPLPPSVPKETHNLPLPSAPPTPGGPVPPPWPSLGYATLTPPAPACTHRIPSAPDRAARSGPRRPEQSARSGRAGGGGHVGGGGEQRRAA